MTVKWYRYEDYREADYDPWGEYPSSGSRPAIRLVEFPLAKVTPKGVWLAIGWQGNGKRGDHRGLTFVRNDSHKRWACPTIEEAEASWRARKAKQIGIYQARIRHAEQALRLMDVRSGKSNPLSIPT